MATDGALLERRESFRAEPLSEEAVAAAWEGQLIGGNLTASSGEQIQVVYRGRRNADAGPDYADAIIALKDGRLLRGDVEIHVRASDWRAHGHGHDGRYNGVVLHVVMWDDVGQPTVLANGATAPVLPLHPFLVVPLATLREKARQKPLWDEPCSDSLERSGADAVRRLLDAAGQQRLVGKAASFEAAIAGRGPEQALYEGIMEALGYAKNREPLHQLAECFPLATLQGLLAGRILEDAARRAEALLLGVAGLLPSQRGRASVAEYGYSLLAALEDDWRKYGGDCWLTEESWNFFRTRPENFPTRRIAGAASLIARSREKGLVDYLLEPLDCASPAAVRRELIGRLIVGTTTCATPSRSPKASLIGKGRAMVVVVNVVLPFAVAYGHLTGQPELADRAKWAFFSFPKLPSDAIVRQMSGQILGLSTSPVVNSASRQQALHHLYSEFCRRRRCYDCPLSRR